MSRRRIAVLGICVAVLAGTLGLQAAFAGGSALAGTAGDTTPATIERERGPTPGNTLISAQSYEYNGRLIEVTPEGRVVWEYAPPDSRVFDAEVLDNETLLVSVATYLPAAQCPERALDVDTDECVYNQVQEIDYTTKQVEWEYTWYDEFITHHEVHDADRLPNGETVIIDMGNDRAFVVNSGKELTWEWSADRHLSPGSAFYRQYGGDPNPGAEADWTHMNDIDRLPNGDFQLSIRNFDSVIEVDRDSKNVVEVYGRPGNRSQLYEQHNPDRLADGETILVADSENQRVVELTPDGRIRWRFGGEGVLTWPRDADRLPDRNTLITDSLNDRVIEVTPNGSIVWEYQGVSLPYSADRIGVPEERGGPVVGDTATSRFEAGPLGTAQRYLSFVKFVLPGWVGPLAIANAGGLLGCSLWLLGELLRARFRSTGT
jgi:hypothetical protein